MSNNEQDANLPCNLRRLLKQVNVEAPNIATKLRQRASKQMETYLQIVNIRLNESDLVLAERKELDHNLQLLEQMT